GALVTSVRPPCNLTRGHAGGPLQMVPYQVSEGASGRAFTLSWYRRRSLSTASSASSGALIAPGPSQAAAAASRSAERHSLRIVLGRSEVGGRSNCAVCLATIGSSSSSYSPVGSALMRTYLTRISAPFG